MAKNSLLKVLYFVSAGCNFLEKYEMGCHVLFSLCCKTPHPPPPTPDCNFGSIDYKAVGSFRRGMSEHSGICKCSFGSMESSNGVISKMERIFGMFFCKKIR